MSWRLLPPANVSCSKRDNIKLSRKRSQCQRGGASSAVRSQVEARERGELARTAMVGHRKRPTAHQNGIKKDTANVYNPTEVLFA